MKEILHTRVSKANAIIKTSKRPATTKGNPQKTQRANYPLDQLEVRALWREGAARETQLEQHPHLFCRQTGEVSGLATEGSVSQFPWFMTPEGKHEGGGCLSIH